MKSSVETLSPTRVRLTVEVPFDELQPSMDEAYKRIAQSVTIPGFRKGKVPAAIIDQRFGREVVVEEAVNEHLPKAYSAAVDEHGVRPIGQPEVDVTTADAETGLAFTAEVDVRPEIELPEYDGIEVIVDAVEVSDEDVTEELDRLRARFGSLSPVERPAAAGDFVQLDLSTAVGGEDVPEGAASGLSYTVGDGGLVDGLDEAVTGLAAGESSTFTTTLQQGEHAGQEAEVTATVTAVRERVLPELDDDFAMTASEFDTLDELRDAIRERIVALRTVGQGMEARDKVLEALLNRVDVPLPERLLEASVEEHFESPHGDDDHRSEVEQEARQALASQFVLDEIVKAEQLSVGEAELSEYLVRNAQRYGLSPEQFAQELVNAGQVPAVVAEVARAKALSLVLERAKVVDSNGNQVDLSELLGGDESDETVEEVAAEGADEVEASDAPASEADAAGDDDTR